MQEIWLRASSVDFDAVTDPVPYLFRIAHNLVLERERTAFRSRRRDSDWGYVSGRDSLGIEPPLAERTLLARERLRMVETALRTVGERAARVFQRYRIEGIDQQSIASELDVSLSTVEKDLRRAYSAVLKARHASDEE